MSSEKSLPDAVGLSPRWRVLLSGLLAYHLFAVFLGPFHFNTIPPGGRPAPDADLVLPWFQPYINFMFLNHGYAFFAPDPPSANHLLRGTLVYADDRSAENLQFPDRNRQRPRLLYHRHFMLSEFLHGAHPEISPSAKDATRSDDERRLLSIYHRLRASYENHLRAAYGAESAAITRIEHRMIPYEVLRSENPSLTDPRSYSDLIDAQLPGGGP